MAHVDYSVLFGPAQCARVGSALGCQCAMVAPASPPPWSPVSAVTAEHLGDWLHPLARLAPSSHGIYTQDRTAWEAHPCLYCSESPGDFPRSGLGSHMTLGLDAIFPGKFPAETGKIMNTNKFPSYIIFTKLRAFSCVFYGHPWIFTILTISQPRLGRIACAPKSSVQAYLDLARTSRASGR